MYAEIWTKVANQSMPANLVRISPYIRRRIDLILPLCSNLVTICYLSKVFKLLKFSFRNYLTIYSSPCGGSQVNAFCCSEGVGASSCVWEGSEDSFGNCQDNTCGSGQTQFGSDTNGGGNQCTSHSAPNTFNGGITWGILSPMALCCNAGALASTQSAVSLIYRVLNPFHES